ncbi:hypothetical protein CDL60_06365 [Roseateles noduli]|nr:hypothetical protein CDL60_06365 [Roseateles noduli]
MRRWLTVFLLILLPLQLSWAVAATYCAHEADPAANHIGHHEHRHEASGDAADAKAAPDTAKIEKAADKALTCVDDDCGFCHLGHSQPVASTPIVLPAMAGPLTSASISEVWSSRGPDRRERPNWLFA